MRLAIFLDQVFWRDGGLLSTNESYALFFRKFADLDAISELIFIGRPSPEPGRASFLLDHPKISLLPIPYYPSLYALWRTNPTIYRKARRLAAGSANNWDALLVHGPHPLGQIIAQAAAERGTHLIPVLRQNLVQMMSSHAGLKRRLATLAARSLEHQFQKLARGRSVLAVGSEMAEAYGKVAGEVHNFMPCLIDDALLSDFASETSEAPATRLITVGRLSPEKGHCHLFDALSLLKSAGLTCQLDVIGHGPLEDELKSRASDLGLRENITFHGFVGYGPRLFDHYRQAGIAVLPSTTEGLPQVINESLAIGLPTVATRVGGIPAFLTDNETGLLVPPGDPQALAAAIERLITDGELRSRLRAGGQALMSRHTLEANRDLVMKVICDDIGKTDPQ